MAVGNYGITRPADVSIDDIDVYFNYMVNRETLNSEIIKLNSSEMLSYSYIQDTDDENYIPDYENLLEGLYNLTLPANRFNKLGIYTIYIKPKKITTEIVDCGVLSSLPNVKGILLDRMLIEEKLRSNNALQGYRIEYFDDNGNKIRNMVRYVVSSNIVSLAQESNGINQSTTRYKFDDSGSLLFLQLTPSSSYNVKPNMSPFIGKSTQAITVSNTLFSPLTVEIEMVENTIDSLTELVAGEQTKDIEKGILTYYDKNRVINRQFNLFQIKPEVGNVPLHEVKEKA